MNMQNMGVTGLCWLVALCAACGGEGGGTPGALDDVSDAGAVDSADSADSADAADSAQDLPEGDDQGEPADLPQADVVEEVGPGDVALDEPPQVSVEGAAEVRRRGELELRAVGRDPEGAPLSFTWRIAEGDGALVAEGERARITAGSAPGELWVEVTASDGAYEVTARHRVEVKNQAPTAQIAGALSAPRRAAITLDGAGEDLDGDPLSYQWRQLAGQEVALEGAQEATLRFTAPAEGGELLLGLVVDDGYDRSEESMWRVEIINRAPTLAIAQPPRAHQGEEVTLAFEAQDEDDDALRYTWSQLSGIAAPVEPLGEGLARLRAPQQPGALVYQLEVTDQEGAAAQAEVEVEVLNHPPAAIISGPDVASKRAPVVLRGDQSHDPGGDPLQLRWRVVGEPAVSLDLSQEGIVTFTSPPTSGDVEVELEALDPWGGAATARHRVAIQNLAPVARITAPAAAHWREAVTLEARQSEDPDGDPITWRWAQDGGAPGALEPLDGDAVTFRPSAPGEVSLRLTVTDQEGAQGAASALLQVTNSAPRADAGADQGARAGERVTLDGGASADPDGDPLTWRWAQLEGEAVTLVGADTAAPSFVAPSAGGALRFELTVSDGPAQARDEVVVQVTNQPPTAVIAPTPAQIFRGQELTLDGQLSTDPEGGPLTWRWEQLSGHAGQLFTRFSPTTRFRAPLTPGPVEIALWVHDGASESPPANVLLEVVNRAPVADAGPSRQANAGQLVALSGLASRDDDGDLLSFAWTQRSGPAVALVNPQSATASFTMPAQEVSFALVVSDGLDADEATVTLSPNLAPRADAGEDLYLSQRDDPTVRLDASRSADPEGGELQYAWRQRSGPSVTLEGANTARPSLSLGSFTELVFSLTVTDAQGLSDTDEVTVLRYFWDGAPASTPPPSPLAPEVDPHKVGEARCEDGAAATRVYVDQSQLYLTCPGDRLEVWDYLDPLQPSLRGARAPHPRGAFVNGHFVDHDREAVTITDVRDPLNGEVYTFPTNNLTEIIDLATGDRAVAFVSENEVNQYYIHTIDLGGASPIRTGTDWITGTDRFYDLTLVNRVAWLNMRRLNLNNLQQTIGYRVTSGARLVPNVDRVNFGANMLDHLGAGFSLVTTSRGANLHIWSGAWPPTTLATLPLSEPPQAAGELLAVGQTVYAFSNNRTLTPLLSHARPIAGGLPGLLVLSNGDLFDFQSGGRLVTLDHRHVAPGGELEYALAGLSEGEIPTCAASGGACEVLSSDVGAGTAQMRWTAPTTPGEYELRFGASTREVTVLIGESQILVR